MQIDDVVREWAVLIGRILAKRWLDRRDVDEGCVADRARAERRSLEKSDGSEASTRTASE
jgi:hypothetical protein